MTPDSTATPLLYAGFALIVVLLLLVDFTLLGRRGDTRVSPREAAMWSLVWVAIALAFGAGFWWYLDGHAGREIANARAMEYLTGYAIEKSLAIDNVFVWITLFSYFSIPATLQKRVLLYGVLGAVVMRAILIYAGAALLKEFHWILYVFGGFLVLTGAQMLRSSGQPQDLEKNPVLKWMRRHLRMTPSLEGEHFIVHRDGVRMVTPLLVVLVLVEATDLVFAVDSIPAIFAVTLDPFVVFTSNIFAILGLRAMYFMLADTAARFHLLKYALALILVFIGCKMLLLDVYKLPTWAALGGVAMLLVGGVVTSLLFPAARPTTPDRAKR